MKNRVILALVIFAVVIFSGCIGTQETSTKTSDLKGTITISGAFALYPMMIEWADKFHKLNPGVKIDVSAGGAGKGMSDALSGMVDIGMVSRGIKKEEIEKGAVYVAVTKDAVLPIINSKNPKLSEIKKTGMTRTQFKRLFIEGEEGDFSVYTRSDACGAAEMWAKYLSGLQEDLKGTGVYGDPGIIEAVKKDPKGIGFGNLNYVFEAKSGKPVDGLAIIPIDLDGNGELSDDENFYDTKDGVAKAIAKGIYPSPPAREEYLVAKDEFTGVAKEFVKWILTDGQQYVLETGYVELPKSELRAELEKLD